MLIVTGEALACSLSSLELKKVASEFDVYISHRSKPISGIRVEVVPKGAKESVFSGSTDVRGIIHVTGLVPGEYFLTASHLGIDTTKQWIDVADATAANAKLLRACFKNRFGLTSGTYE
jgi:hypothetical protein